MKKRIACTVPFFSGFYETIWDPGCDLSDYESEEGVTDEEYDFDNGEYENDVARYVAEFWCDKLTEYIHPSFHVEFEKVRSPREYNFRNDSSDIYIEYDSDAEDSIMALFEKHHDYIKGVIKDRHSSYPGFISFMESDADDWTRDLLFGDDWQSENYFSCLCLYIVMAEYKARGWNTDLEDEAHEFCDIFAASYCTKKGETDEKK